MLCQVEMVLPVCMPGKRIKVQVPDNECCVLTGRSLQSGDKVSHNNDVIDHYLLS